jgi:hypothetical protein
MLFARSPWSASSPTSASVISPEPVTAAPCSARMPMKAVLSAKDCGIEMPSRPATVATASPSTPTFANAM